MKHRSTYDELGVRLQGKGGELGGVLVPGSNGSCILRAEAQRELLAAGGDARDGLQTGLELGNGPRRGNAALRRCAGGADKQGNVCGGLERHDGVVWDVVAAVEDAGSRRG